MRTKTTDVLIVDASVAIKWVVTEPHSEHASALLDEDLAAPELWLIEVANMGAADAWADEPRRSPVRLA